MLAKLFNGIHFVSYILILTFPNNFVKLKENLSGSYVYILYFKGTKIDTRLFYNAQ